MSQLRPLWSTDRVFGRSNSVFSLSYINAPQNIEELKPVKLCLEVRLNLNAIGKRDLLMEGVVVY